MTNSTKERIERAPKLTDAQIKALRHLAKWGYSANIDFRTGEALRKRGLATRHTTYSVRAVYADVNGEHEQYRQDNPIARHEWEITSAGRSALLSALPAKDDPHGQ